ncbi:MAG: hypothetical protein RMJ84_09660 [Sandaracinaceae bacterium]|nr:hypothetical protein [Sandaracinaceae bacterium]
MQQQAPIACLCLALVQKGCQFTPVDAKATTTVRAFIQAIERSTDPKQREKAYRLLCHEAQLVLAERAYHAGGLGAPNMNPWDMIVEGQAYLLEPLGRRWQVREAQGTSSSNSQTKLVEVVTEKGRVHQVQVRWEKEGYCIVLDLQSLGKSE